MKKKLKILITFEKLVEYFQIDLLLKYPQCTTDCGPIRQTFGPISLSLSWIST